jgi:HTH-type transcriptional regulator/antitoxin HipB
MRPIITPGQIGTLLAARRKHLQLSQAEVARRVGISQNRLSVLEKNSAALTAKQLLAILNVLGLEMTLATRAS